MTKQELLEMARKLQEQANSMSDELDSETSKSSDGEKTADGEKEVNNGDKPNREGDEKLTPSGELEEKPGIEPQTNGKITDDVTPKVDVEFEEDTTAEETIGVEEVLSANLDQRFATIATDYAKLKAEMDKMKVVLSEIMTRIELVQEITDKVTTVDHDTLLSESIKLMI